MSRTTHVLTLLVLGLGLAWAASGQMMPSYVYSVSFECGFQISDTGAGGYEPMVKVANYATKIDVHNPGMNPAALTGDVFSTGGSRWASSVAPNPLPPNNLLNNNATYYFCCHFFHTFFK